MKSIPLNLDYFVANDNKIISLITQNQEIQTQIKLVREKIDIPIEGFPKNVTQAEMTETHVENARLWGIVLIKKLGLQLRWAPTFAGLILMNQPVAPESPIEIKIVTHAGGIKELRISIYENIKRTTGLRDFTNRNKNQIDKCLELLPPHPASKANIDREIELITKKSLMSYRLLGKKLGIGQGGKQPDSVATAVRRAKKHTQDGLKPHLKPW